MIIKEALLAIIASALRKGGIETTLAELVTAADAESRPLAAIPEIVGTLDQFGLALAPGIESGDLTTTRVLRRVLAPGDEEAELTKELATGEGARIEYKESLCHHHVRAKTQPATPIRELRSEEVLESSLKTICGFLNTEGGVLLVGVADDGTVSGVEHDFPHTGQAENHRNRLDKWEGFLRSVIRSRFHEGELINNYVLVSFCPKEGGTVVRIVVRPRTRLSVVKMAEGGFTVFLRRGNRTDRLDPWEIEELLLRRIEEGPSEEA